MPILEIGPKNFITGESQSDFISDKGFSPDSVNLNLTKIRGLLYFNEVGTDRGGATLTGNIIASCPDPAYLGNDVYYLDDEGAFYTLDGGTLTKKQTSAETFILGTSDLITFQNEIYATSNDVIAKLTNNFAAITEHWWTGLTPNYRHPMETVEGEIFFADKNVIYYWNGTSSGTAFTLPSEVNITSLRKHSDGRTLLAFVGITANFSHTRGGGGKVYFCDPVIRDWTREIEIEAQIEGTRVIGGIIYTTWGNNFGYFNGNGLVFLKKLAVSDTTYSHNINNLEDILLIRDGRNVFAFGNLGAGNIWWKPFRNVNAQNINNIAYQGDNKFLIAYSDGAGAGKLVEIDYDNAGTTGAFYSNRINFGQTVKIRRIDIFHDTTNTTGTTAFDVKHRLLDDTEETIQSISYDSQSVTKTRIHCDIETDVFQLVISPTTDDLGYKIFRIYYDPIK